MVTCNNLWEKKKKIKPEQETKEVCTLHNDLLKIM